MLEACFGNLGALRVAALPTLIAMLLAPVAKAEPYTIVDNEGFGVAMNALTVDLPQGWRADGRIAWNKPCSGNDLYEVILSASSPDGQSGIRMMPGHQIRWTDVNVDGVSYDLAQMSLAQAQAGQNDMRTQFRNSNCHLGHTRDSQQLIETLILPNRPAGAKVTQIVPNEPVRAVYASTMLPVTGVKSSYDAVIVDMTYPGATGPIAERLWLTWYKYADDPSVGRLPGFPAFTYETTVVDTLTFAWAPEARAATDLAAASAALAAARTDPDWAARVRDEQNRRADARRRANEEAAASREASRRAREEADRQHAAFLETLK